MRTLFLVIVFILAMPYKCLSQADSINLPLITAVKTCDYYTILTALQSGMAVDETDLSGKTPLHHAVVCGNPEIVSLLLLYNADPLAEDHQGLQPLAYAKAFDQPEIIQLLMHSIGNKAAVYM